MGRAGRNHAGSPIARHIGRAAVVLFVGLAAGLCLSSEPAYAHAGLERSEPADGAELSQAPRHVRLWFSEAISVEFSTYKVLDTSGNPVPVEVMGPSGGSTTSVELGLPPLDRGVYTVSWRVLSESDGHTTAGLVAFGVKATVPTSATARVDNSVNSLDVVLRWLDLCFVATLIGGLAVGRVILGRSDATADRHRAHGAARRRIFGLATVTGAEALAVGVAALMAQTRAVTQAGSSWSAATSQLLVDTRWGMLWLIRQALVLALTAMAIRLWRREPDPAGASAATPSAVGALAVGLAVAKASGGHSGGLLEGRGLAVAADALHFLAAAAWIGGLLALSFGLVPLLRGRRSELALEARACLRAFGKWAALSVGVLAATGIYTAGRQVASADALVLTTYGRAMLGKTGLVAAAGSLGLINATILHPRVARPIGRVFGRPPGWTPLAPARLPIVLTAEATVGVLVLLLAGVMGSAPPARGAEFAPAQKETASLLTRETGDILVTLSIKPNRPGQNVLLVTAANTRRPVPGRIEGVTLQLTRPGSDFPDAVSTQEIGPGQYRTGGGQLDVAGNWRVDVSVRRAGIPDQVVPFFWTIPSATGRREVVLSDRPLGPILTSAAAIIAGLVLVGACLAWPRSSRGKVASTAPMAAAPQISRKV